MSAKVQVIFYSMYGHVYQLAESVAQGAREAGAAVELFQVVETLPQETLAKMHAVEARKAFGQVPTARVDHLADADAIIIGTPTRFGAAVSQMNAFLESTGALWQKGALIGKVGSAFTSTGTQHGGQETTIVHAHTFFLHQGMVVVGVPYSCRELMNLEEISGGSPYGASTIAGPRGERQPTANELTIARFQGKHVAEIAGKLAAK